MLGLMKFKKLFWKKSDEHDKLDELDHEFIAGFTKREIIRMIQNMSDEELEKALAAVNKKIAEDVGNSGVHHNHCIDYEFKKRKTKYKADGKNIRTISPSQICRNRI